MPESIQQRAEQSGLLPHVVCKANANQIGNIVQSAGPDAIAVRMFNNLKYQYVAAAQIDRALDVVECQLAVLPGEALLLLEQGEFWWRLGSADAARRSFEAAEQAAAELANGGELKARARRRLREIGSRSTTLH